MRVPGRLWHGAVSIPRAAVAAGTRAKQRLVPDRAQGHAPVVRAAAAGERPKACRSLGRCRRRRREGTGKRNSGHGHGEEEDCSADDDDAAVERTASRDKQSQQSDRERKPPASRVGEVLRQGEQEDEQRTCHAQAPARGDEGEAEGQEHPHGREHRHAVRVADGLGEAVIGAGVVRDGADRIVADCSVSETRCAEHGDGDEHPDQEARPRPRPSEQHEGCGRGRVQKEPLGIEKGRGLVERPDRRDQRPAEQAREGGEEPELERRGPARLPRQK